jgi:putative FmdB family regulatory protein
MPVYEYKCTKCGEKFELKRGFFTSGKDSATCPKCGSTDSERVYSPFCTGGCSEGSSSSTPTRHFG